jgi:hypothetical protein
MKSKIPPTVKCEMQFGFWMHKLPSDWHLRSTYCSARRRCSEWIRCEKVVERLNRTRRAFTMRSDPVPSPSSLKIWRFEKQGSSTLEDIQSLYSWWDPWYFFFSFLGWGETESTWHVGHYFADCTSPWWWIMMSVEQSVEWLAWETLSTRRKHCSTAALSITNPTSHDRCSNQGCRGAKPVANPLCYGMTKTVS